MRPVRSTLRAAAPYVKRVVNPESSVGTVARRAYVRLAGLETEKIETVLAAFARATAEESVFFVQIGANDGLSGDPLHKFIDRFDWAGILVEPVPYVFERLRANRGSNPRLILENVAVGNRDGTSEFFYPREPIGSVPWWYDQLGSFSLETLLRHEEWIPGLRDQIVSTTVQCVTFDTLCRRHPEAARVDLVHLDTEGYDWEIIRSIDLQRYRPTVLLYEHAHLSDADRETCETHLEGSGYVLLSGSLDTLCLHSQALGGDRRLSRAWSKASAR